MPQWQPMFGKTHSRRCFMGLNASWGSHLSSRSKRAEMRRAAAAKVDAAWRRLAMITHAAGRKKRRQRVATLACKLRGSGEKNARIRRKKEGK